MKMKDYSNYHDIDIKAKLEHDGNLIFESSLNGVSGKDILINDVSTRGIITSKFNSDDGQIKYIMGRNEELFRGSVVDYENMKWLVTSIPHFNGVYKKAEITICNNTLVIKDEPTEVLVGSNPHTGQPVYEYQDGAPISYPCIVTKLMENEQLKNKPININGDTINVTLPYFEFKESQIELYGEKYQVKSIDKTKVINGIGLLTILGERV